MLTQIGVEFEGSELILPIVNATPKDSLLVRQITGLNPPDIDLFIGEFSRDGGIYQGRRVGNRNVVATMDLNPNPALGETVSGLREMLYKAFVDPLVDADYVKVNLYDDLGRVRYVVGYAEKFETAIFDSTTLAQISLICPDPYIRNDTETVHTHATGWTTVPFTYDGTAETGFITRIHVNATTPKITLANNTTTDTLLDPNYNKGRMILTRSFLSGDIIRINTIRGQRSLTLERPPAAEISIVGNLDPNSQWLELHSQANTMRVYGSIPSDLIASIRELRYTMSYWGV